jgi:hypothetical protein
MRGLNKGPGKIAITVLPVSFTFLFTSRQSL